MRGHELKALHSVLVQRHNVRSAESAPLPLLSPFDHAQIVEGFASTSDVDADRLSFARGSLTWTTNAIPLLVRHDVNKVAGRILDLRYDDNGNLSVTALVEDPEARRMSAFSIAATIIESEVRNQDSSAGFHFVVTKAILNHIAVTDHPANPRALITCRRDFTPADASGDDVIAAIGRAQAAIERLREQWARPVTKAAPRELTAATPLIYGNLPAAMLNRSRTSFSNLVARLPLGGDA